MSTRSFVAPPAHSTRSRGLPIFPPRQHPALPQRRRHFVSPVVTMASDAPPTATPSSTAGSSALASLTVGGTVVHDSSLAPAAFRGDGSDSPIDWLQYFQRYVAFKQLPDAAALPLFALLMRGPANTWFTTLSDQVQNNYDQLLAAFHAKYDPTPTSLWKRASDFWNRDQKSAESVEVYVADMIKRATECHAADDMTRYAIIKGLRPEIRAYVLQQAPTSTSALLEAAKIAEDTVAPPTASLTEEVLEAIRRLETRSTATVDDPRRSRSPSPASRRYGSTSRERRVHFQDQRMSYAAPTPAYQPSYGAPAYSPQHGHQPRNPSPWQPSPYVTPASADVQRQRNHVRGAPNARGGRLRAASSSSDRLTVCGNCGRNHPAGACAARGQICRSCNKRNHFARCCRSTATTTTHFE